MAKNPYIKFYIGDYIKDTRILPLNVRGGWAELILQMWNNDPQGELVGTIDEFARIMCCSLDEALFCINLLKEKKIFSYEEKGEGRIRIISRKQKKMIEISDIRKETGGEGGNPKLIQNYNKPGYLYAMQRPSDGWIKIGISTNPEKRIYKIRKQLNEPNVELLGSLFVQDMGLEEGKMHQIFASKKKGEWFNLDDSDIKKVKILLKINKNSPYGEKNNSPKENCEYEYEYEYDTEIDKDRKEVQEDGKEKWDTMPGPVQLGLVLPEIKAGSALQFMKLTGSNPTKEDIEKLWHVFKVQNFTGGKFYNSPNDVFSHFINWSKKQTINGTSQQQPVTNNPKTAGRNKLLGRLKDNMGANGTPNN